MTESRADALARLDVFTISGAGEKRLNGSGWEHDFALTCRRVG